MRRAPSHVRARLRQRPVRARVTVASAFVRKGLSSLRLSPFAVAIGAAMFFSLVGDGHNGFWADHPMLGALLSGGLLFAMGVLIVDGFVERRNARRWASVSVAANRELGHLLDETLKVMWLAHSDADQTGQPRGQQDWTPAFRARETRAGHDVDDLAIRRLPVFDQRLPAPDYAGPALTPVRRLEVLFEDDTYVRSARALIAQRRDMIRDAAKDWAGLMMWAEDSQRLLNTLSVFAEDHLSAVEYHLAARTPSEADPHGYQAAWLWCIADVKGRALMNTLWGSSTPYRWAMPEGARNTSLAEAFRKRNRVGKWRPASTEPMSGFDFRLAGFLWPRKRS